jgi:hypothetical protein
MTIQTLQTAYRDDRNVLIGLVEHLRNEEAKYNTHRHEMLTLFQSQPLWKQIPTGSGHATFKHQLTGVVVGFQSHGNSTMKPKQVVALRDCVQIHLNKLCNEIFKYKSKNWKSEPDYNDSLLRYKKIENQIG